jgi:transcriptional regulator
LLAHFARIADGLLTSPCCGSYSHIVFDMSQSDKGGALHGTVDLLVLKALSLEPLHGVGVMQRIEQITERSLRLSYGSLFPALHRMEERGWVMAEWGSSATNRRAKYYTLTAAGRRRLRVEEQQWARLVSAVAMALKST